MFAARDDIELRLGEDWLRVIQFIEPGPNRVQMQALQPGDWVNHRNRLDVPSWWPVFDVVTVNGKTTVRLGRGEWSDPKFTVDALAETIPGQLATITDAMIQIALPDTPETPAPGFLPIPWTLTDPNTVTMSIPRTDDLHAQFAETIDYMGWGPSGWTAPWGASIEVNGAWLSILQGMFTVVRTSHYPFVPPPLTGATP